jgi:plasmid stabilization system protein ParE
VTRRLTFRPEARTELLEIRRWYDRRRPGLGAEFGKEAERALGTLVQSADEFQRVHGEIRRVRLHRFPYAIFYRILGDEVVVLAIMHGRRHPRRWQSRR